MGRRFIVHAFVALSLLLAAGSALAPGGTLAQDATPGAMAGMGPHPAHIHAGSCPEVGDVVFPLTDIAHMDAMGTPMAEDDMAMDSTPMAGMDEMGEVVAMSTTEVEAPLEDILAAEHAINVHLSAEEIGVYIACGDITGEPADGQLEITLEEQNDSGYQGMAMLMDNGDSTTTVDVMLTMSEAGMAQEATPVP